MFVTKTWGEDRGKELREDRGEDTSEDRLKKGPNLKLLQSEFESNAAIWDV